MDHHGYMVSFCVNIDVTDAWELLWYGQLYMYFLLVAG